MNSVPRRHTDSRRRSMIARSSASYCAAFSWVTLFLRGIERIRRGSVAPAFGERAEHVGSAIDLVHRNVLLGCMCEGDVAWAEQHGGDASFIEYCGVRPCRHALD